MLIETHTQSKTFLCMAKGFPYPYLSSLVFINLFQINEHFLNVCSDHGSSEKVRSHLELWFNVFCEVLFDFCLIFALMTRKNFCIKSLFTCLLNLHQARIRLQKQSNVFRVCPLVALCVYTIHNDVNICVQDDQRTLFKSERHKRITLNKD